MLQKMMLKRRKMQLSIPVIIILLWMFISSFLWGVPYQILVDWTIQKYDMQLFLLVSSFEAILLCFYPLAGCLADIKFGRHKTVLASMHLLLIILLIILLVSTPFVVLQYFWPAAIEVLRELEYFWLIILFPILIFHANILPFGIDQLRDSPSDHQSLFIHWYVFTWYTGLLCSQIAVIFYYCPNSTKANILTYAIPSGFLLVLLAVSLWLANRKKQLFFVDAGRRSLYKLVYKVSKFAWQHKVPLRRSAFTYCEDEIPAGLDLGKTKYGGPFITEQVEDVKAFYGILKVIFALGPVFFLYIAAERQLFNFYEITNSNEAAQLDLSKFHKHLLGGGALTNKLQKYSLGVGVLTPTLIVACMPLYIILIRPFIFNYIPGVLKRMGIGIFLVIIALISIFIMDVVISVHQKNGSMCMVPYFQSWSNTSIVIADFNSNYIIIPRVLNSVSAMLIYIALYEFICSQSPHAMKGMLIGLSFATKGVFELLGIVTVLVFEIVAKPIEFLSCGMEYYLMNIIISIIVFFIYVYAAKSYRYRLRDEPCHVYRYAEEYYSKILDTTLPHQ